ncbi:MAG TPA: DUF5916 domain-containing protein [Pyrinomonadaceae bacterium]|jgi:hypothetical protein|nr:DUF5916 domain-containing protein [Pyrinomonadaceae bacterium]
MTTKRFAPVGWLLCFCIAAAAQSASPSSSATKTTNASKHAIVLPPEKSQPITIPRFDKPPVIDGKLDDEVWKHAAVLKDFYQINPGDNIAPSRPTEAMIGFDAKNLYLAFHCYDEPDKVRATVAKRDNVFDEDNVRVFLDTFNDQRRAYVLGWNPLGVQQDGIMTEGQGQDFSVDIVMESKGMITSDGWTLEVAIPFKSLRYEAGKGKLWGIHIWRNIDRFNDEMDSWMPVSRDVSSQLVQEGHITGLENISTEHSLEIIPSLTVSETGKRVNALTAAQLAATPGLLDPGRLVNEPLKFDLGVTAKYSLTPTVTLDLAVNPDFAQVEADQTVVTANQRFPIFFEEKRPFFLEGIDIFQTPIQAVHTRAIVDPDIALKLSGKRGKNTFGILFASDNAPGSFTAEEKQDTVNLPTIARFINKNAYVGILRLKHDVGRQSYIGVLFTSYNFMEKHNQLAGIDGRFQISKQKTFRFQVLGTTSRRCFFEPALDAHRPAPSDGCFGGYDPAPGNPTRPAETNDYYRTGNGLAYQWNYNRDGRHFYYGANGNGQTQDYRADLGFTRRLNTNHESIFAGYNSEQKPKAKLINWNINEGGGVNFNWQGLSQDWDHSTGVNLNFQHNTSIGFGADEGYERIFEQEFGVQRTPTRAGAFFGRPERSARQHSFYVYGNTKPSQKYSFNAFLGKGWNSFDYDFGALPKFIRVSPAGLADPNAPLDPGPGKAFDLELSANYQPTKPLNMSLSFQQSKLRRNDTGLLAFQDNIYSFRSTYQFSRFVWVRARVDYDTLSSDARGQFLFGYTPNPGTAFYVGYNDDLVRNGFNPFTGQLEPGFRRNGRTFFIKMSYLFRKSFGG